MGDVRPPHYETMASRQHRRAGRGRITAAAGRDLPARRGRPGQRFDYGALDRCDAASRRGKRIPATRAHRFKSCPSAKASSAVPASGRFWKDLVSTRAGSGLLGDWPELSDERRRLSSMPEVFRTLAWGRSRASAMQQPADDRFAGGDARTALPPAAGRLDRLPGIGGCMSVRSTRRESAPICGDGGGGDARWHGRCLPGTGDATPDCTGAGSPQPAQLAAGRGG